MLLASVRGSAFQGMLPRQEMVGDLFGMPCVLPSMYGSLSSKALRGLFALRVPAIGWPA